MHQNFNYPYFKFDKSVDYQLVLYFNKQINRQTKYQELKNLVNYSHYAYQIENGIFEYSVLYVVYNQIDKDDFKIYYNYQFNNIVYNLKNNDEILKNLTISVIDPYVLAFMKPEELNDKKWEKIKNRMQKIKDKIENIPTSDVYKCYKCGMRKITTFQVQTRGQDEDATTFVKCHNCGNIWRE